MAMKAQFHADRVVVSRECFTPDFSVLGIHFAEGDPEVGGEHWSFSRASGDDEGVCVVKEIQQAVFYNGIAELSLSRGHLECAFDVNPVDSAGVSALSITFDVNDEKWEELSEAARRIFYEEGYANIT